MIMAVFTKGRFGNSDGRGGWGISDGMMEEQSVLIVIQRIRLACDTD